MGWRETHDEDDPIPYSRTDDSMGFTLVFPFIFQPNPESTDSCYWHIVRSKISRQNSESTPNPFTGSSPPILWSLIGSISFIFCLIMELVVTPSPTLARLLAYWIWCWPSPLYIVTPLLSLFWPRNFTISAWVRLTYMVISPPRWTPCSRSSTFPSNCRSLIHSFTISQELLQW